MAEKVVVELEVKSDKGVKDVQNFNKEISNTNKEIKQTKDLSAEMGSTLDKATGGAITKFKGLKSALKTAVTGFKSLRVAIIGTGIGALLIAITSLGQAFTRSEEGQNKFSKLLGVIGSVTGNLLDLLADLGEGIISVFENPKQALINFKDAFIENITNRFTSAIDTLGFLGSAIKKVFSGDFTGALEDAKKSGSSLVDSFTGVKNSIDKATESTKGFVKELKEEAKIAGQIADQRAKADKVERKLIVERAEADRKVAELREKAADKDKLSAKERIEALEEAGRVSEEITNKEIEAARLRLEAKQAENKLTKSTKADLDEEANLKARLIQLETERLRKQKSITAEISSARKEEKAKIKAEEDAERKAKEEQQKIDDEKDAKRKKELQEKEDERLRKLKEQAKQESELERQKIRDKAAVVDAISQFADAESGIGKALLIVKQGLALKETLMDLKKITFKGTQAVAEAGVSTAQNVANSSKIGFPQNIITIAGAIAQGVGIVRSVKQAVSKTKAKGIPTPTPPTSPIASTSTASQPPAFNVVGSSSTDQLAEAIGGQEQKPVKAYVVSQDVTTAQSLDRNIIDGASI